MSDKARTKAKRLMALALGTPYSEEARTSAVAALRIIAEHDMLDAELAPQDEPKALAKTDENLLAEIERLKRQITRLKKERRDERPPPVSPSTMLDVVNKQREIEALRREIARLQAAPPKAVPIHVVQPGESPMIIAGRYTGNPLRVTELVGANLHKPTRIDPQSGWRTFTSLQAGERLRLPAGWA